MISGASNSKQTLLPFEIQRVAIGKLKFRLLLQLRQDCGLYIGRIVYLSFKLFLPMTFYLCSTESTSHEYSRPANPKMSKVIVKIGIYDSYLLICSRLKRKREYNRPLFVTENAQNNNAKKCIFQNSY